MSDRCPSCLEEYDDAGRCTPQCSGSGWLKSVLGPPPTPPSPEAAKSPTPAWLIERGQDRYPDRLPVPQWWHQGNAIDVYVGVWTTDANFAMRFPTKEAAEAFREERAIDPEWPIGLARVTEHMWVSPEAAPGETCDHTWQDLKWGGTSPDPIEGGVEGCAKCGVRRAKAFPSMVVPPLPAAADGLDKAKEFVSLDQLPLEELLNELERVGGSMALWNSPPNTPESWGDLEKRRLAVRVALLRKDAEREEAVKALEKYGYHTLDCPAHTISPHWGPCDCGLGEALARLREAR